MAGFGNIHFEQASRVFFILKFENSSLGLNAGT